MCDFILEFKFNIINMNYINYDALQLKCKIIFGGIK